MSDMERETIRVFIECYDRAMSRKPTAWDWLRDYLLRLGGRV